MTGLELRHPGRVSGFEYSRMRLRARQGNEGQGNEGQGNEGQIRAIFLINKNIVINVSIFITFPNHYAIFYTFVLLVLRRLYF